ncbi:MAG: hypothetical protein IJW29_02895 [Clostridia bacterium]|nr:hypothetical protein [Clostridia bacterium]
MSTRARTAKRILCGVAYVLPLILGILLLVYASVPHLWFVHEHAAHETLSTHTLKENAVGAVESVLDDPDAATAPNRNFAYAVKISAVVCDVAAGLYLFIMALTALCTCVAFLLPPTHRYANRAKRILYFVCPNRITWLLSHALPVIPALFPHLLVHWYAQFQGLSMRVHFDPMADWIAAVIAIALSVALYMLTLPWQVEEHLDMFRIYKSKSAVPRAGDEVI